ncbi:hypothetical protein V2A60_010267 [Cordyceps javanica]|uniref:Octanoyltransferase-like protein n=1 Tax=Cordyceps javanica TaxID=43265 RepID=A0A545VUE3_9HYPO|nr:octanoyltransferase-like protein [Cordyceps javanica]TQW05341.1 octanoyltransferase-like protein [Cordyceps javanica]
MKRAQRLLLRNHPFLCSVFPREPHPGASATAAVASRYRGPPCRHLHLLQHHHVKPAAGTSPPGQPFVRYDDVAALQEEHRARFLAWKAGRHPGRQQQLEQQQEEDSGDVDDATPPRPQLLSFQTQPTYTLGRRQNALTPAQAERLTRPLTVASSASSSSGAATAAAAASTSYTPQVRKTSRGGLTTYHGPGQLVLWPVLDMHSPLHARRLGVASYARLLEATTQALLADLFGVGTYTNPDEPGVWVASATATAAGRGTPPPPERKIAALGVHHRRYVTALGVALNVHLPVSGEDEAVNPWARFVPCGLQGKMVTSVARETGREGQAAEAWDVEALAEEWARRFEEGLLKG